MLPRVRRAGSIALLAVAASAPAAAQSVAGHVRDARTGEPIPDVRLILTRAPESRVAEVLSRPDGSFLLATARPGEHRIEASHLAYGTMTTRWFELPLREQLVVDLVLSPAAIPLEPLSVTARRVDPRHDASVEGFYARQLVTPPIGSSRVLTLLDPELLSSRDVRDVLTWFPRMRRGCLVVYWNGHLIHSGWFAEYALETPIYQLEGVEFYRNLFDAPFPFRQIPLHQADCMLHSVLVLWTRTGYYGDPPPNPAREYLMAAPVLYALHGAAVPRPGIGFEAGIRWPAQPGFALGLHIRRTAHQLPAATAADLISSAAAPLFVPPDRSRPFTLWTAGVEAQRSSRRVAPLYPVVAVRIQLVRRAFTLQASSDEAVSVPITSWGAGFGITAGGELLVGDRFTLHALLGQDLYSLGAYGELEHRTKPTAARWRGTALRVGIASVLPR